MVSVSLGMSKEWLNLVYVVGGGTLAGFVRESNGRFSALVPFGAFLIAELCLRIRAIP